MQVCLFFCKLHRVTAFRRQASRLRSRTALSVCGQMTWEKWHTVVFPMMKGDKRCPLWQLNINSRMIFCLHQSLAIEVHSFFWAQLKRWLKIWLGEANLQRHGLSTLPEAWKVQGLILAKWPGTFFRQLCRLKPVRPAVGRGGGFAGAGAPSGQLENAFGKSCGQRTAALRNRGWYFKENTEQLIYYYVCLRVYLHILSRHTTTVCGNL